MFWETSRRKWGLSWTQKVSLAKKKEDRDKGVSDRHT